MTDPFSIPPRISDRLDRISGRLCAERGVTLVEVMAATLLLAVGVVGTVGAFDGARRLSLGAELRTSMAHRAQLELERLQTEPYTELAMTTTPTHSATVGNPDYYVSSSGAEYQFGNSSSENAKLAIASGSQKGIVAVSPASRECSKNVGACEWSDGQVSGNVYDFVSYVSNTFCSATEENCPRRLTVAVTGKVSGALHQPAVVRISTIVYQSH
jgi:Tfp pilus assembly protein PilV